MGETAGASFMRKVREGLYHRSYSDPTQKPMMVKT